MIEQHAQAPKWALKNVKNHIYIWGKPTTSVTILLKIDNPFLRTPKQIIMKTKRKEIKKEKLNKKNM